MPLLAVSHAPPACIRHRRRQAPVPLESPAFPLAIGWYTRQFSPSYPYTRASQLPGTPLRFAPFETQTIFACFGNRCLTTALHTGGTVCLSSSTFVGAGLLNRPSPQAALSVLTKPLKTAWLPLWGSCRRRRLRGLRQQEPHCRPHAKKTCGNPQVFLSIQFPRARSNRREAVWCAPLAAYTPE